jgi:signal transduction histidine kinase
MTLGLRRISLLWKILLSTSMAITVLFAAMGWIVQDQFVRIAETTLQDEVRDSFHAYESLWRARAEQLASVSLVLSRMSDVRAAFSTGDQATIRDSAGEVWEKIGHRGALFLVADPRGAVLAAVGGVPGLEIREMPAVVEAAKRFPLQATGFVVQNGRLFQIVVTPVYVAATQGSALLDVLVAGMVVDEQMAKELKDATGGSEFVFLSQGRVIASTLNQDPAQGGGDYTPYTTALLDVAGRPVGELRILRSFDAARRRIGALRTNIVLLWAFAVLAGFALTYLLARRLLKPVKALDSAAAEIAKGNYDVAVEVHSQDEIGRLAQTFNSMCASIRGAREELIHKERISTIGRLSTSIIHDLRNPLASIYGGAEMLVDNDFSAGQVKRLASNIYRSSRRIQELLQELADATRGRPHARELCRLREVIEAAYELVAPAARREKIEVRIEVPPEIEVPLDRSPMERVFQNLLGNAIEAMPGGGLLRISAEREGTDVLVSVEDSGPGIPATIAPQLFKPFVTVGKKNGMGLGLALSRQTVIDHGGDLWADPSVSRGARFVLRLGMQEPLS